MKEHNFENDIKILLIRENGDVDAIFSSNHKDMDSNPVTQIKNEDNSQVVKKLLAFYDCIKYEDKGYDISHKDNDSFDRHLFYLKDFLKNHFVDEFKRININPQDINTDLWLYFSLQR